MGREMFVKVSLTLLGRKDISPAARLVAMALVHQAWREGNPIETSYDRVAEVAGVSRVTCIESFKALAGVGFLRITSETGKRNRVELLTTTERKPRPPREKPIPQPVQNPYPPTSTESGRVGVKNLYPNQYRIRTGGGKESVPQPVQNPYPPRSENSAGDMDRNGGAPAPASDKTQKTKKDLVKNPETNEPSPAKPAGNGFVEALKEQGVDPLRPGRWSETDVAVLNAAKALAYQHFDGHDGILNVIAMRMGGHPGEVYRRAVIQLTGEKGKPGKINASYFRGIVRNEADALSRANIKALQSQRTPEETAALYAANAAAMAKLFDEDEANGDLQP